MEAHFNLNDELFEQQFATCTLDPAIFSHEAHLRLAWVHIKKYGVEKAVENICTQLVNFTIHLGAADKYNTTLTIAAVRAVNHFINRSAANNFYDFIQEFPRLKFNFKDLMASHYKTDIFKSPIAKRSYLEPESMAF